MMLRALKSFDYNRRRLRAGDTFEPASKVDAEALTLVELAAGIEDEPRKKRQKYKTRRMQAEDE